MVEVTDDGLQNSQSIMGYTHTFTGSKAPTKDVLPAFSILMATFAHHLDGIVLELTFCCVNVYMHYKQGSNTVSVFP